MIRCSQLIRERGDAAANTGLGKSGHGRHGLGLQGNGAHGVGMSRNRGGLIDGVSRPHGMRGSGLVGMGAGLETVVFRVMVLRG